MFEYERAKDDFEDRLFDLGLEEFEDIGWDFYDSSLEILGASNDAVLNEELQYFIKNSGFLKCYMNHKDHWETHYDLIKMPAKGWRVCHTHKSGKSVILLEKSPQSWQNTDIKYKVVCKTEIKRNDKVD